MKGTSSQYFSGFDRIVVTGGSSGIGAALLQQLGKLNPNAKYCNISRSIPEIYLPGIQLHSIRCDLSDAGSSGKAGADCINWLDDNDLGGRILLINNSGFGAYGPFPSPAAQRQVDMISVNVTAPVRLTAALEPQLKKNGGAVVNIASTAAFQPTPFLSTYGATKAFLLNWSLALSEDWRSEGIQVLAVCPGPTETAFFKAAGFERAPLEKTSGQTADEVAAISLKALSKGKVLVTCGFKNKFLAAFASKLPLVLITRLAATILRKMRLEQYQKQ